MVLDNQYLVVHVSGFHCQPDSCGCSKILPQSSVLRGGKYFGVYVVCAGIGLVCGMLYAECSGACVMYLSRAQKSVTLLSTEAEYLVCVRPHG